MGQDWKTLSVVIIGAATIGWWTMRFLGGDSLRPAAPPAVAIAPASAPQRTVSVAAEADPRAETAPARIPAPVTVSPEPAAPASGADETALIQRDLELLSRSLVGDQRIEDRVMPRVNDVLDVPGVLSYRRAPEFWQPALADGKAVKQ